MSPEGRGPEGTSPDGGGPDGIIPGPGVEVAGALEGIIPGG